MPSHNSLGGAQIFFFMLGGYASRKRLGTAGLDQNKTQQHQILENHDNHDSQGTGGIEVRD